MTTKQEWIICLVNRHHLKLLHTSMGGNIRVYRHKDRAGKVRDVAIDIDNMKLKVIRRKMR